MTKTIKPWFEVDRDGLRELQEGKPKHHILRELIQNAWDENISECEVFITWEKGLASITVIDDSPEGFRDLSHAYTLFAPTYKRAEPNKRGRFNLGEKQIISICKEAYISTTKGTISFTAKGRKESRDSRDCGSSVQVKVKMTRDEFDELFDVINTYLPPEHIKFKLNYVTIPHRVSNHTFEAILPTEFEVDGIFRKTRRKTLINTHTSKHPYLYEMGIPVTPIESKYSIDVQQKIPLSVDRDTVPTSYLKVLYAEVLNCTFEDLKPEDASEVWVRQATSSNKVSNEAVRTVIRNRYGNKVVVATPGDLNSIDEAISQGFKVIHGRELSKDEWKNVKKAEAVKSSSELFPTEYTDATHVEPTPEMLKYAEFAKKVARRIMNIDIEVDFIEGDGVAAQYGNRILTLNVKVAPRSFFESLSTPLLDLTIHELAHEEGNHTEHNYHAACTKIGAKLAMIALDDPGFFNMEISRLEKMV